MTWKKEQPHLKPFIGCLTCGGGEMKNVDGVILCRLNTKLHDGWTIYKDDTLIEVEQDMDTPWENLPTLMKIENMARKDPDHDWRAKIEMGLRDATYQRQDKGRWVLIASGQGYA